MTVYQACTKLLILLISFYCIWTEAQYKPAVASHINDAVMSFMIMMMHQNIC